MSNRRIQPARSGEAFGFAILDQAVELLANDRLGELGHDFPGDLLDHLARRLRQRLAEVRLTAVTTRAVRVEIERFSAVRWLLMLLLMLLLLLLRRLTRQPERITARHTRQRA